MRRMLLAVLFIGFAAGCATPRVAGQCPEVAKLRCMAGKVCSWDEKRACQVCHCDGPWDPDAPTDR